MLKWNGMSRNYIQPVMAPKKEAAKLATVEGILDFLPMFVKQIEENRQEIAQMNQDITIARPLVYDTVNFHFL